MTKLLFVFTLASFAFAQEKDSRIQFDWDKLASKAIEKTSINLEGPMLQMASQFLSGDNKDEAQAKKLVERIRGIFVRSFEFDKEGQYSLADLNAIRSQLKTPEWSQVADVREKDESVSVHMRSDGKNFQGMTIVVAEPKELTVVELVGPLDLSALSALGGSFGIPKMNLGPKPSAPTPQKK